MADASLNMLQIVHASGCSNSTAKGGKSCWVGTAHSNSGGHKLFVLLPPVEESSSERSKKMSNHVPVCFCRNLKPDGDAGAHFLPCGRTPSRASSASCPYSGLFKDQGCLEMGRCVALCRFSLMFGFPGSQKSLKYITYLYTCNASLSLS